MQTLTNTTKQQRKVAIYLRVSTDEQTKGYGLIFQEEKLRAFIQSQDQVLLEKNIYKDEGFSGTLPIEARPEMQRMFEDIKNNEFEIVYVYRLDRFFRKTKLLLGAIDLLTEQKVGFRSITESFDTTNITGKFMTTLLGAVAEMERDTIRERTVNGRTSAAKAGKWVVGLPPYGYKKDPKTKKLEIVEKEAEVVRKIYELLIYERLSLQKMSERLNSLNIDSPKFKMFKKRKTNNYWYERTIGRLLTNEIYTGTTYFRKYKKPFMNLNSVLDDELKRPETDWVRINVPAIISREMFERAIKQLSSNRENAKRNTKRSYLFSKILYCGLCGFRLFSRYQPPKNKINPDCEGTRYYSGVFRKQNAVGSTKRCQTCAQCSERRLGPIWDCLKDILQNPKNLKKPLEKYKFNLEDKGVVKGKINSNLEKIQSIESKIRKIALLYVQSETVDMKQFKEMEKDYTKDREKLLDENAKLEQSLLTKKDEQDREVVLSNLHLKIKDRLNRASYEDKRYIIQLFTERISLYAKSNRADVVFRFPNTTVLASTDIQVSQENTSLFLSIKTFSEHEGRSKVKCG